MADLSRLLRPRSIAVIGGGAWCRNVSEACTAIGYHGDIWPVHPSKSEIGGRPAFASIADLPSAPDASFIGVNRTATIEILSSLSKRGAGGAVCFASGFAEAQAELADGADLQNALLAAAGDMPFLGPNCYGILNYLDGAALWPDQHGGTRSQSGAAIITQSSNIAINLTMQTRGLPLSYVITAGNQAQTDLCEIGMELLRDPRVTCLGLHIEGINDIRKLEALSNLSNELGKPLCALKIGASEQAQLASVSHTASMAGSHTGATALFKRLGIAYPQSLPVFLELLKLWHVAGPLTSNRVASASCSGGEASLMADLGQSAGLEFPALTQSQKDKLRAALGPKVALANPLDYHTYIWADEHAMTACFSALPDPRLAMALIVLDYPRADKCSLRDWDVATDAIIKAAAASPVPFGVIASLPETLPERVARRFLEAGIVPMNGMDHALEAISLARASRQCSTPLWLPKVPRNCVVLAEDEAKQILSLNGLAIPLGQTASNGDELRSACRALKPPFVLKGLGFAHKSEAGAVKVKLENETAVISAAEHVNTSQYLVEEMVENAVAELLLSVTLDPAHGNILTLGAGGTLTEIMQDTCALLLPVEQADVFDALESLRVAPLLAGYRGAKPADRNAIWSAVDALQSFVLAHQGQVQEVEINPLICTETSAVAADALIVMGELT